jgi:hypothetical protein
VVRPHSISARLFFEIKAQAKELIEKSSNGATVPGTHEQQHCSSSNTTDLVKAICKFALPSFTIV